MGAKEELGLLGIDHMAIAVGKGNLEATCFTLEEYFGLEPNYQEVRIGDDTTAMKTVDMCCKGGPDQEGRVQLALMEGIDGIDFESGEPVRSQISFWEDAPLGVHGPMRTQHVAFSCRDLSRAVLYLSQRNVRFLTEKDRKPLILVNNREDVLQVFTYPIANGFFFELKQRINPEDKEFAEFANENVRVLWSHVHKKIYEIGWDRFSRLTLFGAECSPAEALRSQGYNF